MDLMLEKQRKIIGKAIRTTNQNGQSIQDQSAHWQSFFEEQTRDKIPGKINPEEILGVYTDFESDFMGPYTFIASYEVADDHNIPEGLVSVTISSGNYTVFGNDEKMPLPEKVGAIWKDIWKSGINRNYQTDFEVYHSGTMASDNPEVNIYIGIK